MTVRDIVLILSVGAAGLAAMYLLVLRQVRQIVAERQLKLADHLGRLDEAIRAVETRLAEQRSSPSEVSHISAPVIPDTGSPEAEDSAEDVAPEIKGVIVAAAIAAIGPNAQVSSVKPVSAPPSSPWTQQGRVMVQGSHNLRARQ